MALHFDSPLEQNSIIKVIGVGGGGSNAVNHMYKSSIKGVNFIVCNTDEQALKLSPIPKKIQLGPSLTEGRGAGSQPEVGKNATLESLDEIKQALSDGTKMVFITAGMGGGTGTGGAPIIAKAARELGILTVGIVTTPFLMEGKKRVLQGLKGIEEMKASVDALIVISNDKMRELFGNLALSSAMSKADDILATAARGIADIITETGYVNVDFEDVNTVMRNSGVAIMGIGIADGQDRAIKAVRAALSSPLLNNNNINGAKHILLNITSGKQEILMDELAEITDYIQEEAGQTAEVIWGHCLDDLLDDKIQVTVIATGFDGTTNPKNNRDTSVKTEKTILRLDETSDNNDGFKKKLTDNNENNAHIELKARENQRNIFSSDTVTPKYKNNFSEEESLDKLAERRKRLGSLNLKINSTNLSDLENIPAYKRRNIDLEDPPHSSENDMSMYSLYETEKNNFEIKKRNSFLDNNVD